MEGISKRYGETTALSEVSLRIEDGEFCVLVGPSGCGKSTLLHIVAGLIQQEHGSVLLDGQVVDQVPPKDRDVAMVFQSYALYPHMTVLQNLSFGLRMRGIAKPDIETRVRTTARLLGIESLLGRKPRQLSGGQRQRVAMGRALVRKPRVFLMDEPLSNLDAQLRISVRLELKRLHEKIKTTVLYVTHDQVEAMTLGDKVVVMRDGMVRQIGSPEVIYDQPADTFVATFIGSPVMNLFKGQIITGQGHQTFQCKDFLLPLGNLAQQLVGHTVELGIRPEDIEPASTGKGDLRAHVEMVSNIGAEKYIHATLGQTVITARTSKNTAYHTGQVIPLIVNLRRLHLFHEGQRI